MKDKMKLAMNTKQGVNPFSVFRSPFSLHPLTL